jgi:uncharacterized protein YbjQ (UPF0145 family)
MELYTVESLNGRKIREGEMLYANAVSAANLLRDVREMITNAVGGKMRRYQRLLDIVMEQAIEALKAKAAEKGYDGIIAIRVSHPFMVEGSASVTVYGTGFNFVVSDGSDAEAL